MNEFADFVRQTSSDFRVLCGGGVAARLSFFLQFSHAYARSNTAGCLDRKERHVFQREGGMDESLRARQE
jgi:hypothetical protein